MTAARTIGLPVPLLALWRIDDSRVTVTETGNYYSADGSASGDRRFFVLQAKDFRAGVVIPF
ncbi:MAG: hypothetical protein EPN73_14265 [Paraburkholderia sp.]|uniref:hypothetical protein n=1 Tax=Paraburkholderia sp. TaxID=1926495 RepID=UPI0011F75693|nr:hypothetical protein [Paraburkholderia sp.]TAL95432.1 MAG: hypothetical protein EPN73_14265 [Paraburkholderia sp.]